MLLWGDVLLCGAVCFRGVRRPRFKPWTSDLESWCSDLGPSILDLECGWAGGPDNRDKFVKDSRSWELEGAPWGVSRESWAV